MNKIESEEILLSRKDENKINATVYISFTMQGKISDFYLRELKETGVVKNIAQKGEEGESTKLNYKEIIEFNSDDIFNDPLFKNKLLIIIYKNLQKKYSYLAKDLATKGINSEYIESDMFLSKIYDLYQNIRFYEDSPEFSELSG